MGALVTLLPGVGRNGGVWRMCHHRLNLYHYFSLYLNCE